MGLFGCVLWWEKECWRNVQFNQNCYQSLMSFYIFDELIFFHVTLYEIGVKLTQIGYITKIFVKWICFDISLTTIVKFPASNTFIKSSINGNVFESKCLTKWRRIPIVDYVMLFGDLPAQMCGDQVWPACSRCQSRQNLMSSNLSKRQQKSM